MKHVVLCFVSGHSYYRSSTFLWVRLVPASQQTTRIWTFSLTSDPSIYAGSFSIGLLRRDISVTKKWPKNIKTFGRFGTVLRNTPRPLDVCFDAHPKPTISCLSCSIFIVNAKFSTSDVCFMLKPLHFDTFKVVLPNAQCPIYHVEFMSLLGNV